MKNHNTSSTVCSRPTSGSRRLSGYKLFFHDQRAQMKRDLDCDGCMIAPDLQLEIQAALQLCRHPDERGIAKFRAVASTIAKRWRLLDPVQRERYERRAAATAAAAPSPQQTTHNDLTPVSQQEIINVDDDGDSNDDEMTVKVQQHVPAYHIATSFHLHPLSNELDASRSSVCSSRIATSQKSVPSSSSSIPIQLIDNGALLSQLQNARQQDPLPLMTKKQDKSLTLKKQDKSLALLWQTFKHDRRQELASASVSTDSATPPIETLLLSAQKQELMARRVAIEERLAQLERRKQSQQHNNGTFVLGQGFRF